MTMQWMYLINNTAAAFGRAIFLAANSGNGGAAQAESGGLTLPQIIGVLVAIGGVIFLLVRRNMMNKKDSNTKAPQAKKEGFKIPGREKKAEGGKPKPAPDEKQKSKSLGFKRPGDNKKNTEPEEVQETPQGINSGLNNKYLNVSEENQYSPKVGYTVDLSAPQKQRQNPYAQAPMQNEPQPQLWLAAISGPITYYTVPIPGNGEITIGRGEGNTVAFPEYAGEVSHNHAKLMYVNRMLCLVDTNSVNGTFLVGTGQINPMQAYTVGEGSTFYVGCDKNGFQIVRGQ